MSPPFLPLPLANLIPVIRRAVLITQKNSHLSYRKLPLMFLLSPLQSQSHAVRKSQSSSCITLLIFIASNLPTSYALTEIISVDCNGEGVCMSSTAPLGISGFPEP